MVARLAQLGGEDPAAGGHRRRSVARSRACAAPRATTVRNRIGSLHGADKLSEHAKANAIDIGGFVTPTAAPSRSPVSGVRPRATFANRSVSRPSAPKKTRRTASGQAGASQGRAGQVRPVRSSSAIATKSDGPQPTRTRAKATCAPASCSRLRAPRPTPRRYRYRPPAAAAMQPRPSVEAQFPAPAAQGCLRNVRHGAGPRGQRGAPRSLPFRPGGPQAQRVLRVGTQRARLGRLATPPSHFYPARCLACPKRGAAEISHTVDCRPHGG
jgi:hypothetical protein